MKEQDVLSLKVHSVRAETETVSVFDLRPSQPGQELPAFEAGAHIDLHLPGPMVRSYSLLNDQRERHRFVLGINLDPKSRGGSHYLHHALRVGDTISTSQPRNNFRLDETANHSVMIAGGIGITPLWSMVQRLESLQRTWSLFYSARSREHAALLGELESLDLRPGCRFHLHFDDEQKGAYLDMAAIVASMPDDAHFYACGPAPMLAAFEVATGHLPRPQVHLEYFAATQSADRNGNFVVKLARTGMTVPIPAGRTILECLQGAGIDVPYACGEGVCGSCVVNVLEGEPDHRDLVLTEAEKAKNQQILVCCSGAKSPNLVLDL